MTERRADIRFKINGYVIIFRGATILSDENNFITFIDSKDKQKKTYNKEFLISFEDLNEGAGSDLPLHTSKTIKGVEKDE